MVATFLFSNFVFFSNKNGCKSRNNFTIKRNERVLSNSRKLKEIYDLISYGKLLQIYENIVYPYFVKH